MIEEYKFGLITIDGKTYDYDLELRWTGEILKWWRKESHVIDFEDIQRAIDQGPDTIVIGTGESGVAKVTDRLQQELKSKGIELIIDHTEQATKTFNILNDESEEEEGEQRKVIGLFHLTC
jgi:hypothetical protein